MNLRRPAVLLAAVALTGTAAGCGDDESDQAAPATPPAATAAPAEATPPAEGAGASRDAISGGQTTLEIAGPAATALEATGIDVTGVGRATGRDGRFAFPVVREDGGAVAHEGGLRFTVAGRDVTATDFVVDPRDEVLTARVAGRRVAILGLTDVRREGEVIRARATVAGALREQLGVPDLGADLALGDVVVRPETG